MTYIFTVTNRWFSTSQAPLVQVLAQALLLTLFAVTLSGCATERVGTTRASTLDSRQSNVSGFKQTSGMLEQPLLAEQEIKRVALIIEPTNAYRLVDIGESIVDTDYVTLRGAPLPDVSLLRGHLISVAKDKSPIELIPVELDDGEKLFNISLWDGHSSFKNTQYAGELRAKLAALKIDAVLWIHEVNLPDMVYGTKIVLGARGVARRYSQHVAYAGFEARVIDFASGKTLPKASYTQMSFSPMPQFTWQDVGNRYSEADLNQLANAMQQQFRVNAEEALHMLRFYDFST